MRRWGSATLVAMVATLASAGTAMAGTLDQEQPNTENDAFSGPNAGFADAQTFTAGISGLLDQVDVAVTKDCDPPGDLTVQIRTVDPETGAPTETVLASTTIPESAVPVDAGDPPGAGIAPASMTAAHFSSPATVNAGTQYAIVLLSNAPAFCYLWYSATGNPYAGGTNWFSNDGGTTFTPFADFDHAFRTYVAQPAPPPPPPPPTVDCQGTTVPATNGTEGDDNLVGTINADSIFGLGGNDELDGVDGDDCLDAGEGDDRASGGADNDLVKGGDGRDKVRGLGGKDRLKGQGGVDRINGGEGADKLSGGPGADKLRGGAAKDKYKGNAGNDDLNAVDAKRDRVNCGGGDDKALVDPFDRVSDNCETVREVEKED